MILFAGIIFILSLFLYMQPAGSQAIVSLDNRKIETVALSKDSVTNILGHLGMVRVEVVSGRIRIVEYESPRMIGTKVGWIQNRGAVTACIPCGILIRIEGEMTSSAQDNQWDGIAQ